MAVQGPIPTSESLQLGHNKVNEFWMRRCRQIQRYATHCDASGEPRPKRLTDNHIRLAKRVSSLDQTGEGEEQWPEGWPTATNSWISFFTAFKKASAEWTSALPGTSGGPEPDNSQQHNQLQEADTGADLADLECQVPPEAEASPEAAVDPEHPESLLDFSQDPGLSPDAERPVRVEPKTVGKAQCPSKFQHNDAEYPKPNSMPEEGLGHKESPTTKSTKPIGPSISAGPSVTAGEKKGTQPSPRNLSRRPKPETVEALALPSTSLADLKERAPRVLSLAESPHPGSSLSQGRRYYFDMQRERDGATTQADIPAPFSLPNIRYRARSAQPEPSIASIASTQAQPMPLKFTQAMTSVQKRRREAKAAGRSRFM
ncbi:uncharacterized protein NECHADRAFT_88841 [Fusarium vanettenii 77-13-4]|uniref:Uncharacterized protein n=1 Tax=Fusarium vanettenii (strain ATCC MYA-4622 / CBS 123669 / FGSC 9596 / NRRL 45880 / 77-13-4) TaxID=660122 RepID=C7ZN61_FUSV7|nr:uncharacterized protein NECHADRAFT_88841 [Fusarium vanettenii 77-13-4]EEU34543.1 predicted protein [Fusarium vanettenii 77-13-4]